MKSISLKLQNDILDDTESILEQLKTSRNRYINDAIEFYNQHQRRKLIAEQLRVESKLVSSDSLDVLHDFELLEDEV